MSTEEEDFAQLLEELRKEIRTAKDLIIQLRLWMRLTWLLVVTLCLALIAHVSVGVVVFLDRLPGK